MVEHDRGDGAGADRRHSRRTGLSPYRRAQPSSVPRRPARRRYTPRSRRPAGPSSAWRRTSQATLRSSVQPPTGAARYEGKLPASLEQLTGAPLSGRRLGLSEWLPLAAGWLTTTAKRRAIDLIRRRRTLAEKTQQLAGSEESTEDDMDEIETPPTVRFWQSTDHPAGRVEVLARSLVRAPPRR